MNAIDASSADRAYPPLAEIYDPLQAAQCPEGWIVGHLGQSLDGFIATEAGDSRFVTGHANIQHLHRMRSLCDAVIVGAATVAADDPQLTTREVPGSNPWRIVLDPRRRLGMQHRLFQDGAAPTIIICESNAATTGNPARLPAGVELLPVPADDAGLDLRAAIAALAMRGRRRLFVEGGGRTVTCFLQNRLLNRLHIAVAPLLIGHGRPSVRLPGNTSLSSCLRPRHRIFRMGADVLFDLELDPLQTG